ncbi:hypothetical protein XELAEV_18002806mg [Xenopus laevis]|nr:hypothetical protein XELAEV_18002806mg [Xenopus laevis]
MIITLNRATLHLLPQFSFATGPAIEPLNKGILGDLITHVAAFFPCTILISLWIEQRTLFTNIRAVCNQSDPIPCSRL